MLAGAAVAWGWTSRWLLPAERDSRERPVLDAHRPEPMAQPPRLAWPGVARRHPPRPAAGSWLAVKRVGRGPQQEVAAWWASRAPREAARREAARREAA
ncbi:MAG TPA: hypothetical protein VFJ81_16160, partial [Gemmatimonadales bacterium]|nr:hypothetical protein [Gemmatimonadales bacterium]